MRALPRVQAVEQVSETDVQRLGMAEDVQRWFGLIVTSLQAMHPPQAAASDLIMIHDWARVCALRERVWDEMEDRNLLFARTDSGAPKSSPLMMAWVKLDNAAMHDASLFGMAPVPRSRLVASEPDDDAPPADDSSGLIRVKWSEDGAAPTHPPVVNSR